MISDFNLPLSTCDIFINWVDDIKKTRLNVSKDFYKYKDFNVPFKNI